MYFVVADAFYIETRTLYGYAPKIVYLTTLHCKTINKFTWNIKSL